MGKEMIIELPDGYRIIQREKVFPIQMAEEILCSKRKKKLTSAVRQGDEAVITSHVIECPYCRSQVPAYFRYVGKAPAVSRDAIKKWAEPQYSLFERSDNKLVLNIVCDPKESYICPRCKQESRPFHENITINLLASSYKLRVKCYSTDLKSVMVLSKKTRLQMNKIHFPLTEELEFNLRNGHSSISIKDCDSNTLLVADITKGSIDWSCTSLYKLIDTNQLVKRKLHKAFGWVYIGPIPFAADELSPRNAVAMTRFRGFSRVFYDSIPYDCADGKLDTSFNVLVRRIRTEYDLPKILETSSLPNTKSVRRILFLNPGLFFYNTELEKIWEILDDINYFSRILDSRRTFIILGFLHQYPGAISFFGDYREVKGIPSLFTIMNTSWEEVSSYSLHYCSMSSIAKEKERKRWKNEKFPLSELHYYSIPMPATPKKIRDCSIDGFFFEWLRTRNDYIRAGNTLNNCLKEWTPLCNPVVAIKRNSKIVAAVELMDNVVIQVRAANNLPITINGDLCAAFEKWKTQNSLIDSSDYGLLDDLEE